MDIFSDYIGEAPGLMPFFRAAAPQIFDAPPEARAWDSRLVRGIGAYQESLDATAAFQGDEAVIMTGQQPGLLTGPLYTIYKAITAIQLAKQLEAKHGVPCVPIFWVASDDHDFEEARLTHILTKAHTPLALRYEPACDVTARPMGTLPLEDSLHALVDSAAANAPGAECKGEVAAFLHESLDASDSFAGWTARILGRLFRDTPLVMFSPDIVEARQAAQQILEHEVRHPLRSTQIINEMGAKLEGLGYGAQLVKGANDCNFFLLEGGRRYKVVYEDNQFKVPANDTSYSTTAMLALLEEAPESFSPNVALRCIVQQALFPAAAYVAGPGELAYWAQLKPLFAHFGQPMPFVYPRAQCRLSSIKLNKIMNKLALSGDDLRENPDALLEQVLRHGSKNPALDVFTTHRSNIETASIAMQAGLEAQKNKAGSAPAMAATLHQQITAGLDKLEKHLLQSDQATVDTLRNQLARVTNALAPQRKAQERYYSVFSYLFEYGWDFIPRLIGEIDITSFEMNEIEL